MAEVASAAMTNEGGLHNLFSPRWQIVVGISFGAPALLAQYLVLRSFIRSSIRWVTRTTFGLAIGAGIGAYAGLAAAMVTFFMAAGCHAASSDACMSGAFALTFPAAGGAAGAVAGGVMGVLLRLDSSEWLHDWTGAQARTWAGIGVTFWILAPLLLRQPFSRAGLLDTDSTLLTIALAGLAGLVAGALGGMLSSGHFAKTVGR
ncbi:MAG: hypothetical protein OXL97_08250 [Chloroflexota bacterium]|nr:hypothetical protein [Chloroflexota bacterium]MDE2885725.1 hypothetical protein [Chloroflexota bacterium]